MTQQTASAIFDTQAEAERAVADLRDAGVPHHALSVVTQRGGTTTTADAAGEVTDEEHGSVARGILGGGALGAGLGVAALAIPGVGPLVAAGAIAASAVPGAMAIGAAAGAAAGTLNETLGRHGIDRDDADYYGDRLGRGGVLVTVDTGEGAVSPDVASDILYRNGGHNARRSRLSTF
ncbi:hypothetical protein GCM10011380_32100 [Sphingomonas metalli]|uniref:General stress protein 17M-like domain-containing protein n=1 Tax=Sphingomonas metalli TaxID=1779358 RepID=A0A916WXJ7_9SPHN|nr:hypothetical protein [Sphingomonas metalli]GGB40229.1 hypothetical protein GCM10011380_32100 [Sphingomonas metalli]